ncbi:unnamed protein product [Rangifer tarandus platyrhynchus]|uniref:Uncharacterized protein n=1 Tax=Rangifer tarandus platyrhynchus TaxID=3082113 RepID=A0ABN8YS63_RANTA|nr:unnamed protein product [Rangifer tarandus platyrhynchus]
MTLMLRRRTGSPAALTDLNEAAGVSNADAQSLSECNFLQEYDTSNTEQDSVQCYSHSDAPSQVLKTTAVSAFGGEQQASAGAPRRLSRGPGLRGRSRQAALARLALEPGSSPSLAGPGWDGRAYGVCAAPRSPGAEREAGPEGHVTPCQSDCSVAGAGGGKGGTGPAASPAGWSGPRLLDLLRILLRFLGRTRPRGWRWFRLHPDATSECPQPRSARRPRRPTAGRTDGAGWVGRENPA